MAETPAVSVASLGTPDKDGFLTKQGGAIKTWKKRWFVLKGDTLYYFKTQKDTVQTGDIKLREVTKVSEEPKKKAKYYFSLETGPRTYMIYADSEKIMKEWVERLQKTIAEIKGGGTGSSGGSGGDSTPSNSNTTTPATTTTTTEDKEEPKKEPEKTTETEEENNTKEETPTVTTTTTTTTTTTDDTAVTVKKDGTPRTQIALAKGVIQFLQDEESKVLEFWQIWSESIPPREDLQSGLSIEFHVSTSANMQKLTWRTAGPQNIFIQKMVDFFWNVGAPESEIDRLNDVGALINPIKIGSWIDMSAKGGMDGGWYFPVDIPLKLAIEAADPGEPSKKVYEWAEKHGVTNSWSVGRDMGAAPPRQTEIRVKLPGDTFQSQLDKGLDAFDFFGFEALPEEALAVLKQCNQVGLCLSVITSSEGFVRLGLMAPSPIPEHVQKLCEIAGANADDLGDFEGALGTEGPAFAEYQFLKEGFGYGVYKEGFDIVFHYNVGCEGPEEV